MDGFEVSRLFYSLCDLYPHEAYCSRATVFLRAWNDGVITDEQFEAAREYYGSLWNYCGD